ncbi:MAG: AI-2E family transporter [Chloroflexota bacterium]
MASPTWSARSKGTILIILSVLLMLAIYSVRGLLIPFILAVVVAYVVEPLVNLLHRRLRLKRGLAIAIVYLLILAGLVAIPVTTIPQLITQANNLINNTPRYLQQLGEFLQRPLVIAGYTIPLNELPLEEAYAELSRNLLQILQTVGRESLNIFGSVASATLSTLGWTIVVLVLSFYMVKDYRQLWGGTVGLFPQDYQSDIYRLGREISATWNAFLRGQLILGLIIGSITFVAATILGLPNSLLLGILAGFLEFIPNIGPALAAIPAIVIALFQNEQSWLGAGLSPFIFALIVLGVYVLIQQIENIVLVPRIIGRSLSLHPLVVFVGALAGASVAGILGILLAAPLLGTARLVFLYIYRKLRDLPAFPDATAPAVPLAAQATGGADGDEPLSLPAGAPE